MFAKYCVISGCILAVASMLAGCDQQPTSDTPQTASSSSRSGTQLSKVEDAAISLTAKAAAKIKAIIAEQGKAGKCVLRIRVVPGGCQGYTHKLDLDPTTSSEDYLCESRGIKIALFKHQLDMLGGAEIDFGQENGKEGFKVNNPNFTGEWEKKWLALLQKEKDVN